MTTIRRFADDVLATLQQHLAPAEVTVRGSLLSGDADEYSDVDLHSRVRRRLDQEFFDSLTACLTERLGSLPVRYDPDYRNDAQAQVLKITLHEFPIFRGLPGTVIRWVPAADRPTFAATRPVCAGGAP